MKKLVLSTLILTAITLAQNPNMLRLKDGVNEVQRVIEYATLVGAFREDLYHFEKAKAYRDVANLLVSEVDEVGSRIFMVRSFNASSKAISGFKTLDPIELLPVDTPRGPKGIREQPYEGAHYDYLLDTLPEVDEAELRKYGLFISELNANIRFLRENRGLSCVPAELARAEAYYEGFAYQATKSRPAIRYMVDLFNKANAEALAGKEKLQVAMRENLECYTGRVFQVEPPPPKAKTEPIAPQSVPENVLLTVPARVHFDFDKHNIKREFIPLLNEVVKALKENPSLRVRVEGFTDDIGPKPYNDRLALRRAQEVKNYLVQAGISPDRIEIAGFGKEGYIAENTTPIGRFTNRRAQFILLQVPLR
ncbi:MAG: OmpA family protein [Aquificaceae bacterium]